MNYKLNSIEEYQNLVMLLKKVLEFYANAENYKSTVTNSTFTELYSLIEIDNGSQAQFVLEKIKQTEEQHQKLQEDYNKVINETIDAIENHSFEINTEDLIKAHININFDNINETSKNDNNV